MAASINFTGYSDALVLLGTAGVVVPLVRRFRVNPVLAYLAAGALLGPLGLGRLKDSISLFHWITVIDARNVEVIADLGVVFLLFLIGLELSYQRLLTMRRLVFGLGMAQVGLSALVIGLASAFFLQSAAAAIVVGCCLALSSTAIVIELLSEQHRLSTTAGRTSFSILIAQDLAVVPILLFISIAGAKTGASVMVSVLLALTQAVVAIALIASLGRLMLRPMFRLVAATQSTDLFIAATLFVIVGTGVAAAAAGLSMALGAFIAGLLLAETEFRKAIEWLCTGLATGRISDERLHELRAEVVEAERIANEDGDFAPFFRSDENLHGTIVEVTGNQRIIQVRRTSEPYLEWIRVLGATGTHRLEVSTMRHLQIIDAMLEGDAERAQAVAALHVDEVQRFTKEDFSGSLVNFSEATGRR